MKRAFGIVLVCWGSLILLNGELHAGIMTFSIASPTVTQNQATFVISAELMADPGDQVESFQLGLEGNDALLTAGGTDFSRYSFALDGGTLPGWTENIPIGVFGLGQYSPTDPINGPFLSPTAGFVPIGVLAIDLTGIAGGTNLFVTLAAASPGFDTDAAGVFGGNLIPSMASQLPHEIRFAQPNGVGFQTLSSQPVPEPGCVGLLSLCGSVAAWIRLRRARAKSAASRM